MGFDKNVRQANFLMIAVTLICIVVAIVIFIMNQQPDTLFKEDFTADQINRMHPDMINSLQNRK